MREYVELKTAREVVCSVCKEFAPPGGCPEGCAWMRRLKENAADVAPVVHGKWEQRRSSWYCSNCGKGYRVGFGAIPANKHNYCPNCGARMDGDAHAPN